MNPNHQHLLIIRAVEDADVSAFRKVDRGAPQKVMLQLALRWSVEGIYLSSLGVDSGHDVLDDAVFSGRIHGLKNQQQGPGILRVELVLQICGTGNSLLQSLIRMFLRIPVRCIGGIEILEAKMLSALHAVTFGQLLVLHWGSTLRPEVTACLPLDEVI